MLSPTFRLTKRITVTQKRELPAVDIVSVYEKLTGNATRQVGSKRFGLCPFHEDNHPTNFAIYPETNSFYCFACEVGGDAIGLVKRIKNCDFSEALSIINNNGI